MVPGLNREEAESPLRKMQIYLLEASPLPVRCTCCRDASAKFQTRVWYDDRMNEPITELLCPLCLSRELLQEWGIPLPHQK